MKEKEGGKVINDGYNCRISRISEIITRQQGDNENGE